MRLNRDEEKIVAKVLFKSLIEETSVCARVALHDPKNAKKLYELLEPQRNLFKRLKKNLGIKLSQEEALAIGLLEEVSLETLKEYGEIKEPLGLTDATLSSIARFLCTLKE